MAFESFWEALISMFVSYIISRECTHLLDQPDDKNTNKILR